MMLNQNINWEKEFNKDLAMEEFKTRVENGELTEEEKSKLEDINNFMKTFNIDDYLDA